MKRHFDEELDHLNKLLTDMASKVEEMTEGSVVALIERDRAKAEAITPLDKLVNELELEVDETCLRLLALRQPMAVDLRFITGAMKIGTDLERMGDLAEKIARLAIRLDKHPPLKSPEDLPKITRLAQSMARDCIKAFVERDDKLAAEVIWRDDEVDRLRKSIIKGEKKAMAANEENVEPGVSFILAVHALERLADHATNIAEDVVYMAKGEVIKHGPRPQRQIVPDDDDE